MKMTPHSRMNLLLGLGLSFTMVACGGDSGSEESSAAGSTSSGTSSGTSDAATDTTGTASMPTSDAATGSTGATSTPTTEAMTGEADTTSTTEAATSTGTTTDATTDATGTSSGSSTGGLEPSMSFFVSSTGSMTGDLGGLAGADKRCQDLAAAVGAGAKTWRAYLSAEKGPDDLPVHARERIGEGPWYNAELVMLAADLTALHALDGDYTLFLDENGVPVPGQWMDSPTPNQHDIVTGSKLDGTLLPGKTCADWTSKDPALFAQVGHSDGLGPMMNDAPQFRPWNSVHENGGCHDTAPKGGAGRIYCFASE